MAATMVLTVRGASGGKGNAGRAEVWGQQRCSRRSLAVVQSVSER